MVRYTFNTILVTALFLAVGLSASPKAGAERTKSEAAQVKSELSQQLYSPFCPGKSLQMCPSPGAADLRREIQKLAQSGLSKSEIEKKLLEKHDDIRMTPPPASTNYSLFITLFAGLLGCFSFVYYLRQSKDKSDSLDVDDETEPTSSPEDDLYLEELRDEYK